jgi:pyruvate formate lyase activating enzyme
MNECEGAEMGRIQSIHSFSTVDGPGTRVVVFLQGCPVGCIFCQNPDSWDYHGGVAVEVVELLRRIGRFRPFLRQPGLTISGGEPLAQPEFTLELIRAAHREGWHVALDTSGWGLPEVFKSVTREADLVMFSVKHPLEPETLARVRREQVWANWLSLADAGKPVWLRYVLIGGWTDQPAALQALKTWADAAPNLAKLEILPYNGLAKDKWDQLGWTSPLFDETNLQPSEAALRRAERTVK